MSARRHVRAIVLLPGVVPVVVREAVVLWTEELNVGRGFAASLAWVPVAGRGAFVAECGPVATSTKLRARVLALNLCSMLALYARDLGHARLERESFAGLERTLLDWS